MSRILAGGRALALATGLLAMLVAPTRSATVPTGFSDHLVASGFGILSNFDFLPDGRVLAVEQLTACIWLIDPTGVASPESIGTVPLVQTGGGEAGLLGIAADPRWPVKPYAYRHYNSLESPTPHLPRFARP